MSYIDDHPTNFNWTPRVAEVVRELQKIWPWRTYVNTYWWHPPYNPPNITERYDSRSLDVWGGGLDATGNYTGYRGKPLPKELGYKILAWLKSDRSPGRIHWWIYDGRMVVYSYYGEVIYDGPSPAGPAGSDARHGKHIHVTYW